MDIAYSLTAKTNVESKPSTEGAQFAKYKSTNSVGLKSTIKPLNDNKQDPSAQMKENNSKEGSQFANIYQLILLTKNLQL